MQLAFAIQGYAYPCGEMPHGRENRNLTQHLLLILPLLRMNIYDNCNKMHLLFAFLIPGHGGLCSLQIFDTLLVARRSNFYIVGFYTENGV